MLIAPTERPPITSLGATSSLPEKWGADIIFPAHGKFVGIQRKEFSDLIASVRDGRLAKEIAQMQRLGMAVLIVEGRPRWTTDGYLVSNWGKGWSKKEFRGLLCSVQQAGVWVMVTEDANDTVVACKDLEHWALKDKHQSLMRRPGPVSVWGKASHHDFASHVLQGLPGLGPEMADRIIKHFGKLPIGWTVEQEEMLQVPGVGKKRVEQWWAALDERVA